MESLKFCTACFQSNPSPQQKVWFANGQAFCRTDCKAFLQAVKFERERKYNEFIARYGPKGDNWYV